MKNQKIVRTAFDVKTGKKRNIFVSEKESDRQISRLFKKDREFLEIMAKL